MTIHDPVRDPLTIRGGWTPPDNLPRGHHDPLGERATLLEFEVGGVAPEPKGSYRAIKRGPNCTLVASSSDEHKARLEVWAELVEDEARHALKVVGITEPLDEPIRVSIAFLLPRPKSHPRRVWHRSAPDIDKLVRAVLDGMESAGVYVNDGRVVDLHAVKRYTLPPRIPMVGCIIGIETLGSTEALAMRKDKNP